MTIFANQNRQPQLFEYDYQGMEEFMKAKYEIWNRLVLVRLIKGGVRAKFGACNFVLN